MRQGRGARDECRGRLVFFLGRVRRRVHLSLAVVFLLCILFFYWLESGTVLKTLLDIAGYTYGPLLGLYAFGIFFQARPLDRLVPVVCVLAPIVTFGLKRYSPQLFFGYQMGFEILIVNGALTLAGLWLLSRGQPAVARPAST